MKASVSTTLTAKITLELSENEAMALLGLSGYDTKWLVSHINKFAHGFDDKDRAAIGLISLLETSKSLYQPLEEIKKVRKSLLESLSPTRIV